MFFKIEIWWSSLLLNSDWMLLKKISSVNLSFCMYLSLCISTSFSMSICPSLTISPCLSASFFVSLSLNLSVALSIYLYLYSIHRYMHPKKKWRGTYNSHILESSSLVQPLIDTNKLLSSHWWAQCWGTTPDLGRTRSLKWCHAQYGEIHLLPSPAETDLEINELIILVI